MVGGLVLLSTNSKLIRDRASGHQIQTENPGLVARAIEHVIDAATKKGPGSTGNAAHSSGVG